MAGRPPQAEESAILKVASELFYRSGAKTSLREIAKRVGVTASAISQRFGSKQVLLETVLRQPLAAPLPPLHDGGKEHVELHELVGRTGTHYALHVLETLLPALRLSHQMGRQTGVDILQSQEEFDAVCRQFEHTVLHSAPKQVDLSARPRTLYRTFLCSLVAEFQVAPRTMFEERDALEAHAIELAREFLSLATVTESNVGVAI